VSPVFEGYLARLYTDATERERFLADPRGTASAAGLPAATSTRSSGSTATG